MTGASAYSTVSSAKNFVGAVKSGNTRAATAYAMDTLISGLSTYVTGRAYASTTKCPTKQTAVNEAVQKSAKASAEQMVAETSPSKIAAEGSASKTFSPINPGPLDLETATSFRSATYTETVLTEDTIMYRVSSDANSKVGSYMTRIPQNGSAQSQLDLALRPDFHNTAQVVSEVVVPKGTTIYEGAVAPQNILDKQGNAIGILPGGGNQVYIPNVDVGWFR